ncbi:MAG: low molecular weight phosphotyrosine protein phosphatase [Chloroflexi bacterium]|nr:low molecular weight phosphotyrosine protein phosphatase [Chloroflexota bacterium]
MIKVLFVCLGNICRSPMAEAVFQHMVNQAGLSDKILVDSAGTGSWHVGETAHRGTLGVLSKNGIAYHGRARQFTRSDLQEFDYVLAMDAENLSDIQRAASPRAKVMLFLELAYQAQTVTLREVPDPYYDGRFEYVFGLVNKGAAALLAHIRAQHGL